MFTYFRFVWWDFFFFLIRFLSEKSLCCLSQVSGQEQFPRGQRILSIPIWPKKLGISQNCVYEIKQQQKEENAGQFWINSFL